MGKPIKIIELAEQMIKLSGLTIKDEKNPNGDIEIIFTGLRPGENFLKAFNRCRMPWNISSINI